MKKTAFTVSVALLVTLLAVLVPQVVNADWPGPEYFCVCNHNSIYYENTELDEYTATGGTAYYLSEVPPIFYRGDFIFQRGTGGVGFTAHGEPMECWDTYWDYYWQWHNYYLYGWDYPVYPWSHDFAYYATIYETGYWWEVCHYMAGSTSSWFINSTYPYVEWYCAGDVGYIGYY
jgi:hypothetical protein